MLTNLKKLRQSKSISQKELAEIIGVSQQSINKYENYDVTPAHQVLYDIADYFDVSIDFLLGHTAIACSINQISASDLTNDEMKLVKNYRLLSDDEKQAVVNTALLFACNHK